MRITVTFVGCTLSMDLMREQIPRTKLDLIKASTPPNPFVLFFDELIRIVQSYPDIIVMPSSWLLQLSSLDP